MLESIGVVLRVLLEVLGVTAAPEPGMLAFAGVALAALSLAALVAVLLDIWFGPERAAPHRLRAIDVSTELSQSHPDAAGHARPRAPGFAASAA
jgi:hypothetical protein